MVLQDLQQVQERQRTVMSLLGLLKRELLRQSGMWSVCPGILSSLQNSFPTLHHSVGGHQGGGGGGAGLAEGKPGQKSSLW